MNISISRYADPNLPWDCSVTPEDRAWVLFVPRDPKGRPLLFLRREAVTEDGTATEQYAPA
jgi:hypothetical protein